MRRTDLLNAGVPADKSKVQTASTSGSHPETSEAGGRCCAGCKKRILDRYIFKVADQIWHESCLKCSVCDCFLTRMGSRLFSRDDLILCQKDYLRLYGVIGVCAICTGSIPASELVMKTSKGGVYHLQCFHCQLCKCRFRTGDRYYICEQNRLLCELDYCRSVEQLTKTCSSFYHQPNSIDHAFPGHQRGEEQPMNRTADQGCKPTPPDDASSGYGSPSPDLNVWAKQ